ncbi:MAG: aminodeoxychorismate synthase component I [Gammaproteobacteria bacterium]|nr:aminodeoxychorismate synthase component I [Gammaproteobacteria bacterium]
MQGSVIIRDSTTEHPCWLQFSEPVEIVSADNLSEVSDCWQSIESGISRGFYAAGFVSYESATAFDSSLSTHDLYQFPYLWFSLYRQCKKLDSLPNALDPDYASGDWQPSVTQLQYFEAINKIKQHIRAGDSYQINYTHKLQADFYGDPWAFFIKLCDVQCVHYSAYLDLGRYQILSVSPELFLQRKGDHLLSKPMKGTTARGLTAAKDAANVNWLRNSKKNRAENLMIVDMLRNDMGRIASVGSVKISSLFDVESYSTVHQMTSSVESISSASIAEIFAAMFPCASVTGAPKAKTMQLIKQLEPDARGIYTGSIGFIKPDGSAQFNVAIRTALIDSEKNIAEYGVGGGIVWDSDAASEYEECEVKAGALRRASSDFKLLETLLWRVDDGYFLFDEHLQRLQAGADFFALKIDLPYIKQKLQQFSSAFQSDSRVRLTVAAENLVELRADVVDSLHGRTVVLDNQRSNTDSVFCLHKTNQRSLYTNALLRNRDFDDVILFNLDGLITETAVANIVVEMEGRLFTPAQNAGLLAGVFREHLLTKDVVTEAPISRDQLLQASRVWLINSVRGWMPLDRIGTDCWQIKVDHLHPQTANSATSGGGES